MNFKDFVELTRPVIGGKGGLQKYVRTLFDAILTDDGRDILDDYSDSSFKSYGNGNMQITEIAKAMSPHLDLVEFATFIFQAGESAQLQLCERFTPYLPKITVLNVGDEIAGLFADIIWAAAGTKRKSPSSSVDDEPIDAEVVDDEQPSGAAQTDKNITVIQQQINVIQNGEKNFNLTNNGTMNFNF